MKRDLYCSCIRTIYNCENGKIYNCKREGKDHIYVYYGNNLGVGYKFEYQKFLQYFSLLYSEFPYKDKKECYIRLCDHDYEWDAISGNVDALCNDSFPFEEELDEYWFMDYRDKMRNSEVCSKCIYNDKYDWVLLDGQEERKYKLLDIERGNNNIIL